MDGRRLSKFRYCDRNFGRIYHPDNQENRGRDRQRTHSSQQKIQGKNQILEQAKPADLLPAAILAGAQFDRNTLETDQILLTTF